MSETSEGRIGPSLVTVARLLEQQIAARLSDLGISFREYEILAAVLDGGPLPEATLLARLDLERHSLTPLLNRLERGGWIRRSESPDDRRRKIVHLMPHAERRAARLTQAREQVEQQLVQELGSDSAQQLRALLASLHESLRRTAVPPPV